MWVQSLGEEHALEEGMATHSNILPENPMDRGAWHSESSDFSFTVLFPGSLKQVSMGQHPSVHRAAFFLESLGRTPFPAFCGFCVASFLGSGPSLFFFNNSASSNSSPSLTFPLTGTEKSDAFLNVVSLKMC